MNLVVRNKAELAGAVQSIVEGIAAGVQAARAGGMADGVHVELPQDLVINGILLIDYEDGEDVAKETTPQTTVTTKDVQPEIVTRTEEDNPKVVVTEQTTPPTRTENQTRSGGDKTTVTREYTKEENI